MSRIIPIFAQSNINNTIMNFEEIKCVLKNEFIGLDDVIDRVVEYISVYYQVRNKLTRPMVLNIWGMTGYGKTSMLKRFFELLNVSVNYINLSDGNDNSPNVTSRYGAINKNVILGNLSHSNTDNIFILDEFHSCREYDEYGSLLENKTYLKGIWEIMDDGIVNCTEDIKESVEKLQGYVNFLKENRDTLNQYVDSFVYNSIILNEIADKGFIDYSNKFGFYIEEYNRGRGKSSEEEVKYEMRISFREVEEIMNIYCILNKKTCLGRGSAVYYNMFKDVKTLEDYISVYEYLLSFCSEQCKFDFSKSLIINVGNLNNLYEMSHDISLDISGDDYVDIVNDLTLGDVKEALKSLFKMEQIGRLGNNHIIYPAYSDDTFKTIIRSKLNKLFNVYSDEHKKLECSDSIIDFIFEKYCFANLGVRPLLTSIDNLYVDVICELNKIGVNGDIVEVGVGENYTLTLNGESTSRCLFFDKPIDENQLTITSVHESGHFIVYYLSTGKLPSKVISIGNSRQYNGFMLKSYKDIKTYMSKDMVKGELSVLLAGRMAEYFVFGDGNITSGAVEDIERATKIATRYFRSYSMGGNNHIISPKNHNQYLSRNGDIIVEDTTAIKEQVDELFCEVSDYLLELFNNQQINDALIKSSKMLIDKKRLTKNDMLEIIQNIELDKVKRLNGYETSYTELFDKFISNTSEKTDSL